MNKLTKKIKSQNSNTSQIATASLKGVVKNISFILRCKPPIFVIQLIAHASAETSQFVLVPYNHKRGERLKNAARIGDTIKIYNLKKNYSCIKKIILFVFTSKSSFLIYQEKTSINKLMSFKLDLSNIKGTITQLESSDGYFILDSLYYVYYFYILKWIDRLPIYIGAKVFLTNVHIIRNNIILCIKSNLFPCNSDEKDESDFKEISVLYQLSSTFYTFGLGYYDFFKIQKIQKIIHNLFPQAFQDSMGLTNFNTFFNDLLCIILPNIISTGDETTKFVEEFINDRHQCFVYKKTKFKKLNILSIENLKMFYEQKEIKPKTLLELANSGIRQNNNADDFYRYDIKKLKEKNILIVGQLYLTEFSEWAIRDPSGQINCLIINSDTDQLRNYLNKIVIVKDCLIINECWMFPPHLKKIYLLIDSTYISVLDKVTDQILNTFPFCYEQNCFHYSCPGNFLSESNQHLNEFNWNSESIKGNVFLLVHEFSRATNFYFPETISSFIYGNLIYFEEPVEKKEDLLDTKKIHSKYNVIFIVDNSYSKFLKFIKINYYYHLKGFPLNMKHLIVNLNSSLIFVKYMGDPLMIKLPPDIGFIRFAHLDELNGLQPTIPHVLVKDLGRNFTNSKFVTITGYWGEIFFEKNRYYKPIEINSNSGIPNINSFGVKIHTDSELSNIFIIKVYFNNWHGAYPMGLFRYKSKVILTMIDRTKGRNGNYFYRSTDFTKIYYHDCNNTEQISDDLKETNLTKSIDSFPTSDWDNLPNTALPCWLPLKDFKLIYSSFNLICDKCGNYANMKGLCPEFDCEDSSIDSIKLFAIGASNNYCIFFDIDTQFKEIIGISNEKWNHFKNLICRNNGFIFSLNKNAEHPEEDSLCFDLYIYLLTLPDFAECFIRIHQINLKKNKIFIDLIKKYS